MGEPALDLSRTDPDEVAIGWLSYLWEPVKFCEDRLHFSPDPWQAAALYALADPDITRVYIRSGHGVGKTRMAAAAIIWAGICWAAQVRIPVTAPKEGTLLNKLWPELYKLLAHADPEIRRSLEWTKTRLRFFDTPGWEAIPETARDPEGLAGYHDERVFFVAEEASGIRDEFWPVIEGALTTEGSKGLFIGNPTRNTGDFAGAFREIDPETKLFQVCWAPTPRAVALNAKIIEFPVDRAIQSHAERGAPVEQWYSNRPAENWALKQIRKYGWDSSTCRVRVRGLPPKADDRALVGSYLVWEAYGREPDAQAVADGAEVWSWDISGAGRDRSVQSARKGPLIKQIRNVEESNTIIAAQQLAEAIDSEQPDHVTLDALGIGTGPQDELARAGYNVHAVQVHLPVEGVDYDDTDQDGNPRALKDLYANQRAYFYWLLRLGFESGEICISLDVPREMVEALAEELENTHWYDTPSGKKQIESKDKIKVRIGRSPDVADVLMLFYAESNVFDYTGLLGGQREI